MDKNDHYARVLYIWFSFCRPGVTTTSKDQIQSFVSRKADQIQRQWFLYSIANMAIKGDLETIAFDRNKGLLIHEGKSNSLLLQ